MEAEQFDYRKGSQPNRNMIGKIFAYVYAKSPKDDVVGDLSVEAWVVFVRLRLAECRRDM
jgi:hypothetical protein